MTYDTKSPEEGIIIKTTVDGIDKSEKGSSPRQSRSANNSRAAVKPKPDPYIWGIYIMLLMISVVELFSASSSEVSGGNVYLPLIRHGIFLAIGLGFVLMLQNTHYGYFSRFAWFFAILSLGLLICSTYFGVNINGAQRAISIGGFTIQPPEIVKITVVVLLATILGRNQGPRRVTMKGIIEAAAVVLVFSGFLYKDGLTNTILLFGVSIAMFLIGGMKMKHLFAVLLVYAVFGGGIYMMKQFSEKDEEFSTEQIAANAGEKVDRDRDGTRLNRIIRFIKGVNPDDPITDENRQVIFAKIAQAHGGVFGQGPGNSRESSRLPLAFSDYIYSIIIEDTGMIGGVFLLLLYLFLLARAGRVAFKCSRAFPAFLIMGCAVLIVFQALVHMAIVTGLFPVSGQPLPFISKGGTSVIVMSIAIGIMLSVARFAVTSGDKKAIQAELKELPEDMQAANYSAQK